MVRGLPVFEAFIVASAAPALAVGLVDWSSLAWFPVAFFVATINSLVLGLPLFLFVRSRGWFNFVTSVVGGCMVGAIFGALVAWPFWTFDQYNATVNGRRTIIDGVLTLAGWYEYGKQALPFAVYGAFSGLVFWIYLRFRQRPNRGVQPTPVSGRG